MNWFPEITLDIGLHAGVPAGRMIRLDAVQSREVALMVAFKEFSARPDAISFTAIQAEVERATL